ncbi:MAG: CheR family methyltransferase [Halothece sp. Uz-M2-17]|nr:CheR family methyltransferase [Halothece sp. Uz-M2-17]
MSSEEQTNNHPTFPLVAIGASAGGLHALEQFFSEVKTNSRVAYLVLVHSSVEHPHVLPEILQRSTSVAVSVAENHSAIVPNHIYIIPPQMAVRIEQDYIYLTSIERRQILSAIDMFFSAFADNEPERTAGIILSGMGSDGTLGVKALKAREALVFAQSPETAAYQEMPESAIATGLVDAILPPAEMPRIIEQYFEQKAVISEDVTPEEWLGEIFNLLRTHIGHDFSYYKQNTLLRRIQRRMNLHQLETYAEYLNFLRDNPKEVNNLFREFLIGVTSFFRDPNAFELLQEEILPPILESLPDDGTFRAWIPGCSSGEEVYSLAIILRELIDEMPKRINLQLFGTDIDQLAIDRAREGLFPASIATNVTQQRLRRFFRPEGQFYRVSRDIRYSVVFSLQDVLKDPPFSRLNLLSCRNLLIYLNEEAQKRLLPLFHYTLQPSGILMLGGSETIGSFQNLFYTLDHKNKIFQRREVARSLRQSVQFPTGSFLNLTSPRRPVPTSRQAEDNNLQRAVREVLLEEFCPTAVLIESSGQILHVQGRTGKFLETVSGPPSSNIFDMAREGLRVELASAIRAAISSGEMVTRQHVPVRNNGERELVKFSVKPLGNPEGLAGRLLILLEVLETHLQEDNEDNAVQNFSLQQRDTRITELEKELQNTRESHQTTIEELESSNEELQATNEELESSNEELQATNEELESSKEELQSLNEELQTLNEELQTKVEELSAAEDDMRNLLNSTHIATIFVDQQLQVKRFTPQAREIINLIQNDVGRPLEHITTNLQNVKLAVDLQQVLETLNPKIETVQTNDGTWYQMRIMPYQTTDNRIEGAILTFTHIDDLKQIEEQFAEVNIELEQIKTVIGGLLEANPMPLILLNPDQKIVRANEALYQLLNLRIGDNLQDLEQSLAQQLEPFLQGNEDFSSVIDFSYFSESSHYYYQVNARVIRNVFQGTNYFLLSFQDIEDSDSNNE